MRIPATKRSKPTTRCYSIPDGQGGTMRVSLGKPPTERTIAALQELAAIARKAVQERGDISPSLDCLVGQPLPEVPDAG